MTKEEKNVNSAMQSMVRTTSNLYWQLDKSKASELMLKSVCAPKLLKNLFTSHLKRLALSYTYQLALTSGPGLVP